MSTRIRTALTGAGVSLALSAVLVGGTAFAKSDSPTSGDGLNVPFVHQIVNDGGGEASNEAFVTSQELADPEAAPDGIPEFGLSQAPPKGHDELAGFGFMMTTGPDHALSCHVDLATLAAELGISEEDMQAEFEEGSTLAEIITGHGSTVDEVVAALVAQAEADAAAAVAAGEVTQEQADKFLADLPEHLTEILNDDMSPPALPAIPGAGSEDAAPDERTAEETGTV